jgi:hypothetical protein
MGLVVHEGWVDGQQELETTGACPSPTFANLVGFHLPAHAYAFGLLDQPTMLQGGLRPLGFGADVRWRPEGAG